MNQHPNSWHLPLSMSSMKKFLLLSLLIIFLIFLPYFFVTSPTHSFGAHLQLLEKPTAIHKLLSGHTSDASTIALVSVLDRPELVSEFQYALSTVHCYALRHAETSHFLLISPPVSIANGTSTDATRHNNNNNEEEASTSNSCGHPDFMFRRHCVVANWMEAHPKFRWLLFLDADMAVVNPERKVAEFTGNSGSQQQHQQLIFIDRLFNSEIMAGSYLARNGPFARHFLRDWADYNFRLPNSFHGTDNGAIHALFMERYSEWRHRNACQPLWEKSKNFGDVNVYEVCVRHFIGQQMLNRTLDRGRLKVLPKAAGWVRDGGHTGSRFSRRDFMLHGWKNSTFNKWAFNPWKNPFLPGQHFDDDSQCANSTAGWALREGFITDEREIEAKLQRIVARTQREYLRVLRRIQPQLMVNNT